MVEFVVDFGKIPSRPKPMAGWTRPAFHRNHDPIWSAMSDFLARQTGDVLEIGSGTGQHATEFARRAPQHLNWWPSDIYDSHLKSIAAWRAHSRLENLNPPQRIDLLDPDWTWIGGWRQAACRNALHQRAAHFALDRGAESVQPAPADYCAKTAACSSMDRSNAAAPIPRRATRTSTLTLRAENPEWGVRDVDDLNALAQDAGLTQAEISPMPANNLVLAFGRALGHN